MSDAVEANEASELRRLFDLFFREAFEGEGSWFTERGPEASFLGTIEALTAAQASAGTPTIAAHTEHVRWFLALTNAYARGEHPSEDWAQSWTVTTVDDATWTTLRAAVRAEYETLRDAIARGKPWENPDYATGVFSLIPHAAYHLGAIRALAQAQANAE